MGEGIIKKIQEGIIKKIEEGIIKKRFPRNKSNPGGLMLTFL